MLKKVASMILMQSFSPGDSVFEEGDVSILNAPVFC
jgi:hypothetical protein